MKKNKDIKIDNQIKKVYFLLPTYTVGGGEPFFIRLIEYLLANTDIKVGVIDFKDGMTARTCQKFFDEDIEYIDYLQPIWKLEDDSYIFSSADRCGIIKKVEGKNIKISFIGWETLIGWKTIFEKNKISEMASLFDKTNALCFSDYGCYSAICSQLKKKFQKNYVPIFYQASDEIIYKKQTPNDEINLIWLGRLCEAKEYAIYDVIQNFAKYPTNKKKIFHIIGNGPQEQKIKDYVRQYENEVKFVFVGVLTGKKLAKYIQENADVGVALGTSSLNFAALKVPVIMAHECPSYMCIPEYSWLFDMYEYCTGSPVERNENTLPMYRTLHSFNEMIDDVVNGKRDELGEKCYDYYLLKHNNLNYIGECFLKSLSASTLTYEMLKKHLKYMPYTDTCGIAVHYFNILGLRFKVVHHQNKRRVYFGKICLTKLVYVPGGIKFYVLGLRLLKTQWWGRYSFSSVTADWLKEECKDKYAINELLFKD